MSDDKQQAQLRWLQHAGELIIILPSAMDTITFSPDQARDLAAALLQFADSVKPREKHN